MCGITENGASFLPDMHEYACKEWIKKVYNYYKSDSRFKIKLKDRGKRLEISGPGQYKIYQII